MSDTKAKRIVERQTKLAQRRLTWETHWEEIARYVLPEKNDFFENKAKGSKRRDDIYDATAPTALLRYTSTLDSLLTPRNSRWHGVASTNPELNRIHSVNAYFDAVEDAVFTARYSPGANFTSQMGESYTQYGAWGVSPLYLEDRVGKGIGYKSIFLGECYIDEDRFGTIDTMYRKFKLTASKAMKTFGEELPDIIQKAAKEDPMEEFEFIHCVEPNENHNPGRPGPKFMKFKSAYVSVEECKLLQEGGFKTWPFPTARDMRSPNEIYSRSACMRVLPTIKMLNAKKKVDIRASHYAIDPPLLIPDDGILTSVDMTPGGFVVGGMDKTGRRMVEPLHTGARIDMSEAKMELERNAIKDELLVTIFQMIVDTPTMTATEVLERSKEKAGLLTPILGRIQSEQLGPMIERELQILSDNGMLPEMPPELVEAEGEYEIVYTGPLTRAQKSEEAFGTVQTVQMALETAAYDPTILDNIDMDEYLHIVGEANSTPQRLFKDPETVELIRQQRQEAEAMQQMADAAPGLAQAGLNAARTEKTNQEVENAL